MRILIPTFNRGPARQKTYDALHQAKAHDRFAVALVCPRSEYEEFKRAGYYAIPCGAKGIAATRQWMLDYAHGETVLMLDDDLQSWSMRRNTDPVSYTKASGKELLRSLEDFAQKMQHYAHGSIGHRLFCQHHEPIYFNARMLRALCYDTVALKEAKVKFRLPVMEDFDVQLQLMTKGYEAMIYNKIVQDQSASNVNGGCSTYRTDAVQAAAAHELARLWPELVTVTEKKGWAGMDTVRTDVRVNWRKAAKQGGML